MFLLKSFSAALLAMTLSVCVKALAETHTVSFSNNCGRGQPILMADGQVLSHGEPYTSQGPLQSAIAYLQTGNCGLNGENCTLIELTLINPTSVPGSGSSSDISLISPHAFSVISGFKYKNGCDGSGTSCTSFRCATAFKSSDQTTRQVACQANNVDLDISFC